MNPAEIIGKANQQNGTSKAKSNFLSLEEGKPVCFRMLTAFAPKYVISHSCGVSHVEISKEEFDAAAQCGQPYLCPQCGQPLTSADIEMERPICEGAYMHRFVPAANGKKMSCVCLGSQDNAAWGIIPTNPYGLAQYDCPICAAKNPESKNGDNYKPQPRLMGLAVERQPHIEMQKINGISQPVMTGAEDVMVTEDDGTVHPNVIIVDLPFKSFWSVLLGISEAPNYELSICYFDWQVTKTGTGLSTKYDVQRLNPTTPSTYDGRIYQEYMPDLHAMLSAMGNPKKYTDNGWAVAGYVPEQSDTPMTVPAAQPYPNATAATTSYNAPVSFTSTAQTQGTVSYANSIVNPPATSWAAVQSQIG